MIISVDLLYVLGLDINLCGHVIIYGMGPYEECYSPIFDTNKYEFKIIINKTIRPE